MADVTSTTGASSSRLADTNSFRRDHPAPKGKSIATATTPKHPAAVARRNARERNRVRQVNMGFVTLRNHIPHSGSKAKKLSKVETLRQAASYIRYLREMLSVEESMQGSFGGGAASTISCSTSGPNVDGSPAFYFTSTPPPVGPSSESYFGNGSSPYSIGHFSEPANIPQEQKPGAYGILSAAHLKISPASSTDSPRSSSFVSSSGSSELGNGYECVSPPQLRSYNVQQSEFMDQNHQHRMAPYHRLPQCQPPFQAHSMQMYS